jgi:putative hydrolase of the HAD superfamily
MKLLIWDFDGTLGYRAGGMWSAALFEVVQQEAPSIPCTLDQLRPYLQSGFPWHTPERPHPDLGSANRWWQALFPVFEHAFEGLGFDPPRAHALAHRVRAAYVRPDRWRLYADTLPALDALLARGWSHTVLSNHVPELHQIIAQLDLAPRLVRVFCSAETGYEKPHPEAFRLVLRAFPDATHVWMIGDSLQADVVGARAVGLPAVLVRRLDARAERCCGSLSELVDLIA